MIGKADLQSGCSVSVCDAPVIEPRVQVDSVFADTTFVRFLAILLVANSHLESLYPRAWMAGDGMLGDPLFFAVSGFNLFLSPRGTQMGFAKWLWRRVTRLYPSLFLVVLVFVVLPEGTWRYWTAADYFREFIWPTRFTFFYHIIFCYIALYLAMSVGRTWIFPLLIGIAASCVVGIWLRTFSHLPPGVRLSLGTIPAGFGEYRFLATFLGAWLATRPEGRHGSFAPIVGAAVLFMAYVGSKYAMVAGGFGARFYPLLHLQVALLIVLLFRTARHRWVLFLANEFRISSWLMSWVAGLTLEIYLIHELVARSRWVQGLKFPVNLIGFAIGTLVVSALAASVVGLVQEKLLGRRKTVRPAIRGAPLR